MRQVTCWSPVPDAPTSPTEPRRTVLANPSGTPSRIAVPQSGPMTRSPLARAIALSSISSSTGTLSLNRKTLHPRLRAFIASAVAYGPGVAIRTRFVAASSATASAIVVAVARVAADPSSVEPAVPASRDAASSRAAVAASSSVAKTATTRSFGPAVATASNRSPAAARTSRFAGVAMTRPARSIPSRPSMAAAICISSTESR